MDNWEDDPELQESWEDEQTKSFAQSKSIPTTQPSSQKRTTSTEDDFFASLMPPSADKKKTSSKFDAIAAELERKKRIEQAVQESDLDNARSLFGEPVATGRRSSARNVIDRTSDDGSIDAFLPEAKEDFDQLAKIIVEKVLCFKNHKHFPEFVEHLVKDLVQKCNSPSLASKLSQLTVGNNAKGGKPVTVSASTKKTANVSISGATSRKKDLNIDYSNYDDLSDDVSEYSD